MKKAIYTGVTNQTGVSDQRIFMVDPPLEGHEFVCVSAAGMHEINDILKTQIPSMYLPQMEPETYIFPCTPEGNVTSWGELEGSYRGGLSHAQALLNAGYEIVEDDQKNTSSSNR